MYVVFCTSQVCVSVLGVLERTSEGERGLLYSQHFSYYLGPMSPRYNLPGPKLVQELGVKWAVTV